MSEGETIHTEELRRIYKLILDGYDDSDILKDILNMHTGLEAKGENNLPLQIDINFITGKRKEMKIATEVLKDSIKKILNIYKQKQREDHFTQIKEISTVLIENNLNTLEEPQTETSDGTRSKYSGTIIYTLRGMNYPIKLNRMELINTFTKNVEKAVKKHGVSFFYDYYAFHLQTIIGKEMEAAGGFWPEVEKNPYKVIKTIKDIVDGKGIIGTCPLCNLVAHLPPFLGSIYSDIL